MFEYLKNKRVLLTGAGTLSYGLANDLKTELAVYSRNESRQHKFLEAYKDCKGYLGDIRDFERITHVIRDFKPDIIIHTAASKKVDVCEHEPILTVENNLVGTLNVGKAAWRNNVEAVIGIGTDKEVDPCTTYGRCKLLSSQILLDFDRLGDTKFSVVRYGNVTLSASSVLVKWLRDARLNQPIKITNPDMTRFLFTIKEGVELINYGLDKTLNNNGHGKIFSTKMCASTLSKLADAVISSTCSQSQKEIIGARVAAEKIHECLISNAELKDTIETKDFYSPIYAKKYTLSYFITSPGSNKSNVSSVFTSDIAPQLTSEELINLILEAENTTWQG